MGERNQQAHSKQQHKYHEWREVFGLLLRQEPLLSPLGPLEWHSHLEAQQPNSSHAEQSNSKGGDKGSLPFEYK